MLVPRLLLVLQAGFVVLLEAHNQIPPLSISHEKSFKVRTFISHVKKDVPKRYRYLMDEAYSSEQKRTIIKYKTLTSNRDEWFKKDQVPYEGTVIVDGCTKPPLVVFANFIREQWCKELDWLKFEQLCQIGVLKSLSKNQRILDDESSRIHGPSNILFWFEQIRDQLEPVKATLGVTVRDVPSVMFKHPFTGPESVQTYTYYATSQIGKGGKGMPLRITIDYPEGSFVQYDFVSPAETVDEPTQSGEGDYFANELILDEFFIPRASGCSLAGNHSDFTLSNHIRQHDSFSFEARAATFLGGRDMMARVAYDKGLNAMRVDRQTGKRGSNLLADFKRGRTYRSVTKAREGQDLLARKTRVLQPHEIVNSKCRMMASPKSEANIELVLLGSQGSWRYLGLARLRGIKVRAYEAYDTQWPTWLQQPVLYLDQNHDEQVRSPIAGENVKLGTVVYVLDGDDLGKTSKGTNLLVGMEIFHISDLNQKVLSSILMSIHGFDWQVDQLVGWPRTSAIFSMADQCAANQANNQHLQVSMFVTRYRNQSADDGLKEALLVNKNRDLSLLQSIQNDLGIPSSELYDFRSDLLYHIKANSLPMSMTFRLAKNRQPLVRLLYFGTGYVKANLRSQLTTLEASLRDCYNLAAHREVDTFFGYSSKRYLCSLDLSEDSSIPSGPQQFQPRSFDLSKDGKDDIYLVRHVMEEEEEPDLIAQLRDSSRRSSVGDSQLMKRLSVPNPSQTLIKISFAIRSFKIFDTPDRPKQTDSRATFNLGLVPDANLVKLLKLGQANSEPDNHKKAIDFNVCQMACLLDPNCATFSYCLRGSQVECALTSVDFNDANLVFQLIDHFKEQTDRGVERRELTLKVDTDKEVRVIRRAACELHTKSYLDLFRKSNQDSKVNLENVIIEPAFGGREECARRCFSETEKVLKKLSNVTDDINSSLEESVANHDQLFADGASKACERRRQASSELCQGFHYIDSINLSSLPDDALAHFKEVVKDIDKGSNSTGFCCTEKPIDQRKSTANEGRHSEETAVNLEEFYFKFETIYEKQPGLRLLQRARTVREDGILSHLSHTGSLIYNSEEFDKLFKDIITRRENTQLIVANNHIDETSCAKACTLQTKGPWPACRSFDILISPRGINQNRMVCVFNSISYADAVKAKRVDLIDVKNNQIHAHYEPKFNIEGLARWRSSDYSETPNKSLTWATSYVLVLGLITGLVGGMIFGLRKSTVQDSETLLENMQSSNDDVDNSFNLSSLHVAS